MADTIHVRATRQEIRHRIRLLAAVLSGRAADQHDIRRGFMLRMATAWFALVRTAFIVKARGGTDEAGISWPPLTRAYLAYGRRFGRGEQAAIKAAAGLGRANRLAPGDKKGLLTAAQLKRWRQVYARTLAWMTARGEPNATGAAAAIAWATLKREGAQTKLDVFGSRQVDILRDTGVLFNSLSPGTTSGASYQAPDGQIVETNPGELVVGTNVEYAGHHHNARNPRRRRQLWPEADQIPQSWWQQIIDAGTTGLAQAFSLMLGGRAA